MKRGIFIFGFILTVLLAAVWRVSARQDASAGPAAVQAAPERGEIPDIYRELLDFYYDLILNAEYDRDLDDIEFAVLERTSGWDREEALRNVGYAVMDVSGDETPELFIGAAGPKLDIGSCKNMIYAVYTVAEDEPEPVMGGWWRSNYCWMGGSDFLYVGTLSALYTVFGTFTILPDGLSMDWTDYYFSYEKEGNFSEVGYYQNASGVWDPAESEELKITSDEFWRIWEGLLAETRPVGLIPLSEYAREEVPSDAPTVRARWAEDALPEYSDYDEFSASDHELRVRVLYETDRAVRDFRVLGLTFEDFGSDGKPVYTEEELYRQDRLTPERPLVVELVFYGDLPNNGFSYVDADGEVRKFAVSLSGLDGSLTAVEY